MKIIHLINFLVSFLILDARYSLYHSDSQQESNSAFDCLYAYLVDNVDEENVPFMINYNLIPYCRRLDQNEEPDNLVGQSSENLKNTIKFTELYQQRITSTQLLEWSAPLDVAERYEKNGNNSNELFFNCSLPWFGSKCQYRFHVDIPPPFKDVFQNLIGSRSNILNNGGNSFSTCYTLLTDCYGGLSSICLDWREICDGKFNCPNGEDEQFCELLEINECPDNEYRCHFGGQCIPSEFVRDGIISTDCLDGTDEIDNTLNTTPKTHICLTTGTFQCEELGRRYLFAFSCGDGQFIEKPSSSFIFRSICSNNRNAMARSSLLTSLDYISNIECQQAFSCLLQFDRYTFDSLSSKNTTQCEPLIEHCTSDWIVFPEYPILLGFFQFIYLTNRTIIEFDDNHLPDFICFNASQCPGLVSCSVDIGIHNGLNCCRMDNLMNRSEINWHYLRIDFRDLVRRCLTIGKDETCSHPSLFYCRSSSKCISKHRVADGEMDCYFGEDESFSACNFNHSWRYTCESNQNKCLSMILVGNENPDCENKEDEITIAKQNILDGKIPFTFFCDEEDDLLSTDTSNDTDETDCEWWPCNTANVRCDNIWHCLNGADELNCPGTGCSLNEFKCYFGMRQYICVPALHLIESPYSCSDSLFYRAVYINDDSYNSSMNSFLWNKTKCITEKQLCSREPLLPIPFEDTCLIETKILRVNEITVELWKDSSGYDCWLSSPGQFGRQRIRFLTTSQLGYFPPVSTGISIRQTTHFPITDILNPTDSYNRKSFYCDRGIHIYFNDNKTEKCLCPPSYFGDRCQWQNQRISLTLQFIHRTLTYTTSVFQVIIMIIDEQRQIAPYHEQILYVPTSDCNTKFNIYLLYPDRPKNLSANYSLHIDVFDKITLKYWASWHLSIPFYFLPVNRISTQLFIPIIPVQKESCSLSCGQHGRCIRYINKNLTYFCQCDTGYSGLHCDIQHDHSCSSDSYSLSSSICICPWNKFGPKCYLKHEFCESIRNPCQNNGICVPVDDRIGINQFRCLCTQEFQGTRCEYSRNRIDIELNNDIIKITSTVFAHFITAIPDKEHQHITTFKKILFDQINITFYVKQPFHILLIELSNESYYLTVIREKYIESESIQTKLVSNQQCIWINNLLNETLKSYSDLRRIKYYPLVCRQNKELKCFYDDHYMCICDLDRFSNCFLFNHSRTYDCQGYIKCENEGKCFQDNITCPSRSICVCEDCFYGTRCQFSTKGFVLSLDYILGYHIKPNITISRQPFIIKMSIALTTIMFILGLINGILSVLTFRIKKARETGCGFYLFVSSWISLITIIILIFKFWYLVLSQMTIFTNRTFLTINCIVLDVMINILLASGDWFGACVSVERVITVNQGVNFNKTKSKKVAKWTTLFISIFIILTHLPDPIYRRLIDDKNEDEQRTWCLVEFVSYSLDIFNTFMTLFHFLVPFIMNLISSIIIVISISRHRSTIQPRLTFEQHLKLQIKKHQHHLIALGGLLLLAIPRLIISFINGCMKSPRNSWLFLGAYLLSFLPSMLTLFVSILPSKLYKREFTNVMSRTIQRFRNRWSTQ